MRALLVATGIAALLHAGGGIRSASAQSSVTPLEITAAGRPPAGWSFTPAIDYAFVWDSNVLMENVGSTIVSEQLHVIKPRGALSFVGRRGQLSGVYGGAFAQHPNLSSLNSFDQRGSVGGTRVLSRRMSLSGGYSMIVAPTTELVELVGVPFSRVGSQRQDARAGLSTTLSRKTSLSTSYRFQKVDFDDELADLTVLNGGYSHGASVGLRHSLSERLAFTTDYFADRATFINGSSFTVQNGRAGVAYAINIDTSVYGSAGVSYLGAVAGRESRIGPSLEVGLTREFRATTLSVSYHRSYVPSYGFGGTSDNEELRTTVRMPLTQRLFTRSALSFRRNQPLELTQSDLTLRTLWYHASLGYVLTDWARVEGYTSGSRQQVDRPDGRVNRYTFGVQITAATTTRIR